MNYLKIKNDIFKILVELFVFDRKKRSIIKARWAKRNLEKYLVVSDTQDKVEADVQNKSIVQQLSTNKENLEAHFEVDQEAQNKSVVQQLSTNKENLEAHFEVDQEVQNKSVVQSLSTDNLSTCVALWQYWHQGKENAPDLIQKCFESVQKYESDKEIHVLSFDTIKNYVEIPQKYYDLLNSGKIPIAIFSDILRLYLLEKYGGCWVDSTIYLTDKIPQSVWDSDFCVVQKNPLTDLQENKMSCYFIRAKKDSANLRAIKRSIENYWAENDFLLNYFMFEHISTMLSCKTPELKSEWDNMPYLDGNIIGTLQTMMEKDFNKEEFNNLKTKTFMHKLTYKKHISETFLNNLT